MLMPRMTRVEYLSCENKAFYIKKNHVSMTTKGWPFSKMKSKLTIAFLHFLSIKLRGLSSNYNQRN